MEQTSHTRRVGYRKPAREIERDAELLLKLAASAGARVEAGTRALDFGCGIGDTVRVFLERGIDAWGVDVREYWGAHFDEYWESRELPDDEAARRLRVAQMEPYRLPFADQEFDFIVSTQVFEHVQDYESALRELGRILKRDGVSVHVFPARWRPVEAHVNVPLASVLQTPAYLKLWARLGRRIPAQQGMTWQEVANDNLKFLREQTNYPTAREIIRLGRKGGVDISFAPHSYVMHHPGLPGRLLRRLPPPARILAARAFGAVSQRVMVVTPRG